MMMHVILSNPLRPGFE